MSHSPLKNTEIINLKLLPIIFIHQGVMRIIKRHLLIDFTVFRYIMFHSVLNENRIKWLYTDLINS